MDLSWSEAHQVWNEKSTSFHPNSIISNDYELLESSRHKRVKIESPLIQNFFENTHYPFSAVLSNNHLPFEYLPTQENAANFYKVPIERDSSTSEIQELVFHRLPFIFIASTDGLESVTISIDPEHTYWETLRPSAIDFMNRTKNLNYENITVNSMKEILRKYGLNSTGKKAILIEKIKKVRELLARMTKNKK